MHEMVLKHKYDPNLSLAKNYEKVLKAEARLFEHLNTLRKKLTKLDELRAEVCQGDELATDIEEAAADLVAEILCTTPVAPELEPDTNSPVVNEVASFTFR